MLKLDSEGLSVQLILVKHHINLIYFKFYWIMAIYILYF